MFLQIMLLGLALVSSACAVIAALNKRRNIGFIITAVIVAVCDVICVLLFQSKKVLDVKNYLTAYYFCYAWLFFGVFWTITKMGHNKFNKFLAIPLFLISAYQTVMMVGTYFGNRIMFFSKHIFLGRAWWVAGDARADYVFYSFKAYRILAIVSTVIIFAALILYCIRSASMFRLKYIVLIVLQAILAGMELDSFVYSRPVWVFSLAMNIVCVVTLYLAHFYSVRKFRDWSIMSFANEMSDGFLVYDEYDDLIHMNALLKNTLPEDLLISFQDKEKLDAWISDTIMVDNLEVISFESDGGTIYFKTRKKQIDGQHSHVGTIYTLHDTTKSILQMRAMKTANEELERAAKMKSDFLANMSHEIRTPMNAVIGMAEIAMREELTPQVMDYLSQIKNSGRNLLNIINDILDFSKIEAGKMEIIPEYYEPLSELNDIANVLVTRIGDKELELFVTADTDIPHALEGDAMRIRQIIINLANNAIKFTKQGIVCVRVSCEKISEEEVNMTYHVIDTGSGIKEEDLTKLFESFQQVDSKRNRSVEGTGLGLAISKSLCQAMGGSIGVTSEYGKGSDFYFTIPQKVLDASSDLVVEDAQTKHTFCLDEANLMSDGFIEDMRKLHVDGRIIHSLDEYQPTGERDFLFFKEEDFGANVLAVLNKYKDCTGVVLVKFDSEFTTDQPNLRIMRRPETILAMVMMLNDKEVRQITADAGGSFMIDFITPDAKILIVDDNAVNITIAEGLLHPLQAQLDSATSGKEAISKLQSEPYDLVLMDHMMPEMDGIETTRVIRETIPSAKDVPILAVTANAMEGAKEMFLKEGMNDFVAKPIDVREIVAKVKQWLPESKIQEGAAVDLSEANGEEAAVSFDGLDSESALEAIGSPAVYRKIVNEYYKVGDSEYNNIRRAYEEEDWPTYTIKVHALKSGSRQIGGYELGDMAERLEHAGNEQNVELIHEKTEELLGAYRELLDKLAPYFEEDEDDTDKPEISGEELTELLRNLSQACEDLDMDTMEEIEGKLKSFSYPEEQQEHMKELYQTIESMDIDACVELIEKIL